MNDALRARREVEAGVVGVRRALGVVHEDHVEIGAVADVAAPELSHREHGKAARLIAEDLREGAGELFVGQCRKQARRFARADDACEIGDRDLDHDALLGDAQAAHECLVRIGRLALALLAFDLNVDLHFHGRGRVADRASAEEDDVREIRPRHDGISDEAARGECGDEPA